MAYKVYLNNETLIFDSSLQDDEILFTRAIVNVTAQGAGSFDFIIPPCHKCFGQFNRLKDYIDIYRDDEQILSTRVYSITDTMDGQQAISCEGLLSMLSDSVYEPETFQGTLQNLVKRILDSHNNQVGAEKAVYLGTFTIENSNVYRAYQNYETSISRLNDLLKTFGGYMMIRKNYDPSRDGTIDVGLIDVGYVDTGTQMYYLDWLDHFTTPCTQKIELTSNLLDVRKVQDSSGIATVILPLGAQDEEGNRLTIESVNAGSKVVVADSESIAAYGYVVKSEIWDDVTVASNLKTKALAYLQACLTPKTEIKLSAVDLADAGYDVDSFRVGQMVTVKAPQIGTEPVQFACVKQNLDLLDPAQNKLELGEVRIGYVQSQSGNSTEQILMTVAKQIQKSEDVMQQAINYATSLISGNEGGYVVLHDADGDGYPDEILVMDTADIETAVKVWRWNNSGLGYSDQGYSGPYISAWTIGGQFNADFITVGTMLFDRLKGGTLELGGVSNQSGVLIVKNASGTEIGRWDKDGIQITSYFRFTNGNVSTAIGSIYTFLYLIIEDMVYRQTDAFNVWYKSGNNTITRFGNTSYSDTATEFAVTNRNRHSKVVTVTPATTNVDTSSRPTSGIQCNTRVDTQSSISDGTIERYSVYVQDLANSSNKIGLSLGFTHIYLGKAFPTAGSSPSTGGSTVLVDCNLYGIAIRGGDSTISVTSGIAIYGSSGPYIRATKGNNSTGNYRTYGGIHAKGISNVNGSDQDVYFDVLTYGGKINDQNIQLQSSSSKRYKHDIDDLIDEDLDPHKLYELPAAQFRFNEDHKVQYQDMKDLLIPGFIAEKVAEIYPAAVIHDEDGNIESWDERRIIPGMLALIQEQHNEIEELKKEMHDLKEVVKCILKKCGEEGVNDGADTV